MGFIDKIRIFVNRINDKIRLAFFYLGLHLTSPISLLGLIISISGFVIWLLSVQEYIFKIPLPIIIFTFAISSLFLANYIYLTFPPAKRAKIIADAYGNNPRIIPFIAKKVKGWLEDIIKFMEKQPKLEKIENAIVNEEPLQKFLNQSSTEILIGKIEKKGNYLINLISGVSGTLKIPHESFEELITSKVDIN